MEKESREIVIYLHYAHSNASQHTTARPRRPRPAPAPRRGDRRPAHRLLRDPRGGGARILPRRPVGVCVGFVLCVVWFFDSIQPSFVQCIYINTHAIIHIHSNVQALLKHPTSPLVLTREWLFESVIRYDTHPNTLTISPTPPFNSTYTLHTRNSKTALSPEQRFRVLAPAFSYNQQQQPQPPQEPTPPADGSLLGFARAASTAAAKPGGSSSSDIAKRGLQQPQPRSSQRSSAAGAVAAAASVSSSARGGNGGSGGGAPGPFSPRGLLRRSNTIGALPSSTAPAALDRHHQHQQPPPKQHSHQEEQELLRTAAMQQEEDAPAATAMDADTEEEEEEEEDEEEQEQAPLPPPPPPVQSVFARPQPVRALKSVRYRPGSGGGGGGGAGGGSRNNNAAPAGFVSAAARGGGGKRGWQGQQQEGQGEGEGKRRRSAFDSALRSRVDSQMPGGHGSMAEESQVIGYGEG